MTISLNNKIGSILNELQNELIVVEQFYQSEPQ